MSSYSILLRRKLILKSFMTNTIVIAMIAMSGLTNAKRSQNWTGYYLGPKAGVIFNNAQVDAQHLGLTNPSGTCNTSGNFWSIFPGLQLGYAHEFDSKLILGMEGDFTYNFKQRKNLNCVCPTNSNIADRFTLINRQQGSLRARIGYAFKDNFFPFFIIGGSIADLGLKYHDEAEDYYSKQTTRAAWLGGIGLEWLFSNNWSINIAYLYTNYNSLDMKISTIYGLSDASGKAQSKMKANTIELALNYWFKS